MGCGIEILVGKPDAEFERPQHCSGVVKNYEAAATLM
jgi:hypothetical protein